MPLATLGYSDTLTHVPIATRDIGIALK